MVPVSQMRSCRSFSLVCIFHPMPVHSFYLSAVIVLIFQSVLSGLEIINETPCVILSSAVFVALNRVQVK